MSSIPTKSANTTHSDTKKIFNSELSTIRSFNDDDLPYFNLEPQSQQNLALRIFTQKFEDLFEKLSNRLSKLEELHSQIMKKFQLNEQIYELKERDLRGTLLNYQELYELQDWRKFDKYITIIDKQSYRIQELDERLTELFQQQQKLSRPSQIQFQNINNEISLLKQSDGNLTKQIKTIEQDIFKVINLSNDANTQLNDFLKPLWEEIGKNKTEIKFLIQILKSHNKFVQSEKLDPLKFL